jgi:hypothetical protein
MMTWAGKRQMIIAGIVIAGIAVIGFVIFYPTLTKAPTCSDTKQNGGEAGIDCGGPCNNFCPVQVQPLIVKWYRAFPVVGATYSLTAYIENPNTNAIIKNIPYEFRVYDKDNKFLAVREGSTSVTPNGPFTIFEPGLNLGNRIPARVTFKFMNENPLWVKADATKLGKINLTTKDIEVTDTDSTPRVTATLVNNTTYGIRDVDVTVVLYDSDDNVIAVSKTYFSNVAKLSHYPLIFTWPKPFDRTVVRKEILTKFDLGNASLY